MPGTTTKFLRFTKIEHTVFSLPLIFAGAWLGAGRAWPAWEKLGLLVLAGVGARDPEQVQRRGKRAAHLQP